MPREEAGAATFGVVALTGADDVGYRLLLWEDHVTTGGSPRSGPCWRLDVGGPALTERGGGDATPLWGLVSTLEPVAWTAEETVFFAASRSDVTFTADVEVVTTPLDERMADGTRFWFVRVPRDGRRYVTLDLHDAEGRSVGTAGPLVLEPPS